MPGLGLLPLALLVLVLAGSAAPKETCHFPKFLQNSKADDKTSTWMTRIWWLYKRHAPEWAERQEIIIKNGLLWRYRKRSEESCNKAHRRAHRRKAYPPCLDRVLVHNQTCYQEERPNTFKVIQLNADRSHTFICIKFVERSDNVVQIYTGTRMSVTNDLDLCNEEDLVLENWPWTRLHPEGKPAIPCQMSGGYSFRTIRRLTNEDLCEDEWRRSSLEVECLEGEGMEFFAPRDSKCNPFTKHNHYTRLTCWASWKQGDFLFIVASEASEKQPSYCMRFPVYMEGEFSVFVYFSVICPTEEDGKPNSGIEYYELRMFRKDHTSNPVACFDDDEEKCKEMIVSPERCAKDRVIAPHCPKTCGQCLSTKATNILQKRCDFPSQVIGVWTLFESMSRQDIQVNKEILRLTVNETYRCLAISKGKERIRTVTLFDNGCAPRYTCMEFQRHNNNLLQFRVGSRERSENKLNQMCPMRERKHSYQPQNYKNLILTSNLWPSYCELGGVVGFNGTIDGRPCQGTLSDWREDTCSTRGSIMLKSDTCRSLMLPMEFRCLGIIESEKSSTTKLLFTRSMDGRKTYHCWVLTSAFSQLGHWPRRVMYRKPSMQCSLREDLTLSINSSGTAFYLDEKPPSKECQLTKHPRYPETQNDPNKSTDPSYKLPIGGGNDPKVQVKTKSPAVEHFYTDPPHMGVGEYPGNGAAFSRHFCGLSSASSSTALVILSSWFLSIFGILKFLARLL